MLQLCFGCENSRVVLFQDSPDLNIYTHMDRHSLTHTVRHSLTMVLGKHSMGEQVFC